MSRARRRVRSVLDFHRSAYYFYRKRYLPSRAHPMIVVLVGGFLVHLAVHNANLIKKVYSPRETLPSDSFFYFAQLLLGMVVLVPALALGFGVSLRPTIASF